MSVDPINGHVVEMLNIALEISFEYKDNLDVLPPLWHPEMMKEAEAVKSHMKIRNARRAQPKKTWRDKEKEEGDEMSIG